MLSTRCVTSQPPKTLPTQPHEELPLMPTAWSAFTRLGPSRIGIPASYGVGDLGTQTHARMHTHTYASLIPN